MGGKKRPVGFLGHAAVYGLGIVLVQGANLLLVPLYTRRLSRAEYGAWEVLTRTGEVALICFLLHGLRQATLALYNQSKEEDRRRGVVGAGLLFAAASGVLSSAALLAYVGASGARDGPDGLSPLLVFLAAACVFFESLCTIPMVLYQARVESGRYLAATLGLFLLRTALSITFVVVAGMGLLGALLASALTWSLFGLVLPARELLRGGPAFDLPTLREMFWFALPFLPGGVALFVLNNGDRFFLKACWGDEVVGLYALGYKVAWTIEVLTRTPLHMVWSGQMHQAAQRDDAPEVFGAVFRRIVGFHLWGALGVCLLQDELVWLAGGEKYAAAAALVPPVALASVCSTAAALFDCGLYVRRRTALKAPITLGAAAVILVLYAVLIPAYGAMGGAVATLLGFATLAGFTYAGSQSVFPVRYDIRQLAGMVLLACGLWLASRALPTGGWAVVAKLALGGLYVPLLWLTGGITPEEVRRVGALAQRALGSLGVRAALKGPAVERAGGARGGRPLTEGAS